ncbi:MAG: hypothetical protein AABM29_09115 [Actinomycetota bacterium]
MTDRPVRPSISAGDHFRAWLVTGPLGRLVSFCVELAAALGRAVLRRR